MGFSIKSQLGGDSTLLNASQATNFNFKIEGGEFADLSCIRVGAEESLGRKMRCQWGDIWLLRKVVISSVIISMIGIDLRIICFRMFI